MGKVREEVDKCHFISGRKCRLQDRLLNNGRQHMAKTQRQSQSHTNLSDAVGFKKDKYDFFVFKGEV